MLGRLSTANDEPQTQHLRLERMQVRSCYHLFLPCDRDDIAVVVSFTKNATKSSRYLNALIHIPLHSAEGFSDGMAPSSDSAP